MNSQPPRGFTLIEMMTVVAIIAIVAGLAINGMDKLRQSTRFSTTLGQVLNDVRKTRAEAFGRGAYTEFAIDTKNGSWLGVTSGTAAIDLSQFADVIDGGIAYTGDGGMLVSGTLPPFTSFVGSYGASLPAPFVGIPTSPACSYCGSSGIGVALFTPSGQVLFSNPTGSIGEQFTVTGQYGPTQRIQTVAIVGMTGDVEAFTQ